MSEPRRYRIAMLCSRHNAFDGRVFQLEARELARAGHQVTIIAPRSGNEPRSQVVDGIRIITYDKARSLIARKYHTVAQVVRLAMRVPADVLHVHEVDSTLLAAVIVKRRLKKQGRDIKLVFDSHEVWPYMFATFRRSPFLRRLIVHAVTEFEHRMVTRHVDAVITAHELEKQYYLWQDPWTPAFCVIGAPPLDEWPAPVKRQGAPRVIGHDGYFSLQRGMDVMLGAFEQLAPDYPEIRLLAAGAFMNPEDEEWYRAWVARTGMGDRVETTGWLDRRDALAKLDTMDIGLVANRQDIHSIRCWPANKMMYYMGRGIPVVSTPAPLYRLYIEENRCGAVAAAFTASALADAIRPLLQDPALASLMGRNGREAVLRDFHPATARKNLHAAYASLEKQYVRGDESVTLQG